MQPIAALVETQAGGTTGVIVQRDALADPHASLSTIPAGGTPVGRVGIVAWDGQPELRLRSSPDTSTDNVIASLGFNTTLQVIKEFPGGWYLVSTQDGQLGYVAKVHVKINLPEPNAKLHRVASGLPGFAMSIAEHYYRQHAQDWGQDLRFYVNVLAWVNNRPVSDTASGWREVHFNPGEFIWIPSHGFALTLRGVVNSGSISHNAADSIGSLISSIAPRSCTGTSTSRSSSRHSTCPRRSPVTSRLRCSACWSRWP